MRKLVIIAVVGLAAQLVDGGLGMGYGVTSTSLLLSAAALTPAVASATVHLSELGTTAASGIAHWRLGWMRCPLQPGPRLRRRPARGPPTRLRHK